MKGTILERICTTKEEEVKERLGHITKDRISKASEDIRIPLDFYAALGKKDLSLLAEIKKASPSKGLICANFDPVYFANQYEAGGASAISVLTDETYFQGSVAYLKQVREQVQLPILRKDFIIDAKQIRESYEMGADAILLIVACLTDTQLSEFYAIATGFGLACLVETHTQEEIERAIAIKAKCIGINNRNLKIFETNLQTSLDLHKYIPKDCISISESGIRTKQDCSRLQETGFNAVLIGETIMRQPNPQAFIEELLA